MFLIDVFLIKKNVYPISCELTICRQLFEFKISFYSNIMNFLCSYFETKLQSLGAASL